MENTTTMDMTVNVNEMDKEINAIEKKYSRYYKLKEAYEGLYHITVTTLLVLMSMCVTKIIADIVNAL